MVLVKKLKICHVFLFGKIGQGNVFDDILERKQAILNCNKRSLKRRKIGIFFLFLLGIIGQENVFYCILNRKNAFL